MINWWSDFTGKSDKRLSFDELNELMTTELMLWSSIDQTNSASNWQIKFSLTYFGFLGHRKFASNFSNLNFHLLVSTNFFASNSERIGGMNLFFNTLACFILGSILLKLPQLMSNLTAWTDVWSKSSLNWFARLDSPCSLTTFSVKYSFGLIWQINFSKLGSL